MTRSLRYIALALALAAAVGVASAYDGSHSSSSSDHHRKCPKHLQYDFLHIKLPKTFTKQNSIFPTELHGLISKQKLNGKEAEFFCRCLGEELVDIDQNLFTAYFPPGTFWVGSLHGDDFGRACIAVNRPALNQYDCKSEFYAVCSSHGKHSDSDSTHFSSGYDSHDSWSSSHGSSSDSSHSRDSSHGGSHSSGSRSGSSSHSGGSSYHSSSRDSSSRDSDSHSGSRDSSHSGSRDSSHSGSRDSDSRDSSHSGSRDSDSHSGSRDSSHSGSRDSSHSGSRDSSHSGSRDSDSHSGSRDSGSHSGSRDSHSGSRDSSHSGGSHSGSSHWSDSDSVNSHGYGYASHGHDSFESGECGAYEEETLRLPKEFKGVEPSKLHVFISKHAMTGKEAERFCKCYGSRLVDIPQNLFTAYFPDGHFWVGSFHGESHGKECLAVQRPALTAWSCKEKLRAVCEAKRWSDSHGSSFDSEHSSSRSKHSDS